MNHRSLKGKGELWHHINVLWTLNLVNRKLEGPLKLSMVPEVVYNYLTLPILVKATAKDFLQK